LVGNCQRVDGSSATPNSRGVQGQSAHVISAKKRKSMMWTPAPRLRWGRLFAGVTSSMARLARIPTEMILLKNGNRGIMEGTLRRRKRHVNANAFRRRDS
jgi:hypothetical protein